jgi:hypothetical protein
MRKLQMTCLATLMAGACVGAGAADMAMMDTNRDNMISKDEFMKHHEAMFDKMKKNGQGMVAVKDMQMSMDQPMRSGDKAMMKKDGMMADPSGAKAMEKKDSSIPGSSKP